MGSFDDAGDCLRFVPKHEVEWGLARGGVGAVVVDEFGQGNVVRPCFRVGTAEDAEVGFDFLVESLRFSIGLRVVSCRQGDFISEDASEFFHKVCGELGAAI